MLAPRPIKLLHYYHMLLYYTARHKDCKLSKNDHVVFCNPGGSFQYQCDTDNISICHWAVSQGSLQQGLDTAKTIQNKAIQLHSPSSTPAYSWVLCKQESSAYHSRELSLGRVRFPFHPHPLSNSWAESSSPLSSSQTHGKHSTNSSNKNMFIHLSFLWNQ